MKKSLIILAISLPGLAFSQMTNAISYNSSPIAKAKEIAKNFTFNYYAKYLGPSLGSGHKNGETFDRYNSGQNYMGGDIEPTGSYEVYQSFRLGYKLKNNAVLSYGVTFQEDMNNAEAKSYSKDKSSHFMNSYKKGYSDNNHRLSYWTPIYSNNSFFISGSVYYEMPTTKGSQESDMRFGTGFQPTIGFFTSNPNIMTGFNLSFERDFYKKNEKPVYFSDGSRSKYNQKYQVARASVSPYFNYILSDALTFKSSLSFDWDQQGNQADTLNFNNNMVDIATVGLGYRFTKNLSTDLFVEASLNEMSLNRTAVGLAMTLSI